MRRYFLIQSKLFLGEYYIDIFYANQLVNGSPFKCNVFDPNKIRVVPCLFGVVDQPVKFEGTFILLSRGQIKTQLFLCHCTKYF